MRLIARNATANRSEAARPCLAHRRRPNIETLGGRDEPGAREDAPPTDDPTAGAGSTPGRSTGRRGDFHDPRAGPPGGAPVVVILTVGSGRPPRLPPLRSPRAG